MPFLIMLVMMFLVMALPIVLYNRWLKGKGGYINPGRQLGAKHWQDYNKPSDQETHR